MKFIRALIFVAVGTAIAGCQTTGPASVKGGECRIFERPEYAVLGKRQYDQDYIDGNIEAGVGGCGWKRPAKRPASFDTKPGPKAAVAPKRRGLIKRIKDRVTAPFSAPAAPVAAVPVIQPVSEPPKPRDPVDELLSPSEPPRRVY